MAEYNPCDVLFFKSGKMWEWRLISHMSIDWMQRVLLWRAVEDGRRGCAQKAP